MRKMLDFLLLLPILGLGLLLGQETQDQESFPKVGKYYRIQAVKSGLYLHCESMKSGALISQADYSSEKKDEQLWTFIPVGKSGYKIQLKKNQMYLGCTDRRQGAELIQTKNSSEESISNQLWRIHWENEEKFRLQVISNGLALTCSYRKDKDKQETGKYWLHVTDMVPNVDLQSVRYSANYQAQEQRKSAQYWRFLLEEEESME